MSWLQISRSPLGFFQTQCLIPFLITHAWMMSATLPLLCLLVYDWNHKILFCLRLVLIWKLERLCKILQKWIERNCIQVLDPSGCCVALCVETYYHADVRQFPLMAFQDLLLNSFNWGNSSAGQTPLPPKLEAHWLWAGFALLWLSASLHTVPRTNPPLPFTTRPEVGNQPNYSRI